jgi:hypothetical protein
MSATVGLFLVLFGCSDDMSACQRIEAVPTVYVSETLCQGDQRSALMSKAAMSADYPSVVAQCVTGKQLAAYGDGPVDLRKGVPDKL